MEEAVFLRELNKYKVVRRDDFHKIRWNSREIGRVTGEAPPTTTPAASSIRVEPVAEHHGEAIRPRPPGGYPSDDFFEALAASAAFLSEEERKSFLHNLRAVSRRPTSLSSYFPRNTSRWLEGSASTTWRQPQQLSDSSEHS